jgi:outer membrane protein
MRFRILSFLLILTMVINSRITSAQKTWSLDECIQYALQNNLDIASKEISTAVDKEHFNQARRNRLPSLGAGSNYNINFGKSVDPNTNDVTYSSFASNSYGINSSLTLFNGFVKKNTIDYNRFSYLAGMAEETALKNEIAFDVMNAFHSTLYYKGFLEIVKQQKELSELNLEKVKKEAEVGISAKTDVLEIEARLADEELLVIRTDNNYKAALLELKRIMHYPVNEILLPEKVSDSNLIQSTMFENADSVYQLALQHLPTVKAKNQQLKAVEKTLAIAKGYLMPSVSVSGGYNTGFYETRTDEEGKPISFQDQLKNNASQNIGFSLSIPLFNRWSTRSEIKLYKLNLEKQKVELENYKNQLYYEIESYCQELSAISAEYIQAKKQTESNELAFEVAEKKKEQGLINILDFYTSKNLLSNAQSELLRSKLMYLLKRKTIDFYLGKPVFGINSSEK